VLYTLRDQAVAALTRRFVTHPWPATFLLIVSPLVTWLWLGAIICVIGGLIALLTAPVARARRRARVRALETPGPATAPAPPVRELV